MDRTWLDRMAAPLGVWGRWSRHGWKISPGDNLARVSHFGAWLNLTCRKPFNGAYAETSAVKDEINRTTKEQISAERPENC